MGNRLEEIPTIKGKQRILISPLNWGLGHATRCIPIIEKMISDGHYVILAPEGESKELLKKEFPFLEIIDLSSFKINYSNNRYQAGRLILQLPQILKGIYKEHKYLKKIIRENNISYVISDNRFGLWSKDIPSIYITHQLMVKMPKGLSMFEFLGWLIHRFFISKYKECWIPDIREDGGLSGDLAHKYPLPKNAKFIGPLSRFETAKKIQLKETYDIVVLVSGPEPHRTFFEEEWSSRLAEQEHRVLIVRGQPSKDQAFIKKQNVTFVSHLDTPELKAHLLFAKQIICRSGYSTIMDLFVLNKKALMFPTPGQTEQEYLAKYFMGN